MSWLIIIATLCQHSVATGRIQPVSSDKEQVECQKQLIDCYRKYRGRSVLIQEEVIADCVLKE